MIFNNKFKTISILLILPVIVLNAATSREINLVTEFFTDSFRLTGATLKNNLKKKTLEELMEAQKGVQAIKNDVGAQQGLASSFQTQVPNVKVHLQTIEGWIAKAIEEKQPKQVPVQSVAPKPTPVPAIENKAEPTTIEAKIIEPKAIVSAIQIPMDNVHNLIIFIEPSVKRGKLFEFNYSSLALLKEMQQTAIEAYEDDNTMRYIAEKLHTDLPSVKISLSSFIGQLPKQIVQKEAAEKKGKQEPRRWGH